MTVEDRKISQVSGERKSQKVVTLTVFGWIARSCWADVKAARHDLNFVFLVIYVFDFSGVCLLSSTENIYWNYSKNQKLCRAVTSLFDRYSGSVLRLSQTCKRAKVKIKLIRAGYVDLNWTWKKNFSSLICSDFFIFCVFRRKKSTVISPMSLFSSMVSLLY